MAYIYKYTYEIVCTVVSALEMCDVWMWPNGMFDLWLWMPSTVVFTNAFELCDYLNDYKCH